VKGLSHLKDVALRDPSAAASGWLKLERSFGGGLRMVKAAASGWFNHPAPESTRLANIKKNDKICLKVDKYLYNW
jgi:hypothetical protein